MKCVWCKKETDRIDYVVHREGCPCIGGNTPCRKVPICRECASKRVDGRWK